MASNVGELLPLPIYLLLVSLLGVWFLVRAVRDACKPGRDRAATYALLSLAVSQLLWALPCFVQCLAVLVTDGAPEPWKPSVEGVGCDVMGFYSVFASLTGEVLLAMMFVITYSAERGDPVSPRSVQLAVAATFVFALVACGLPLAGVGAYRYTGGGFCYYDWSNVTHSVILLVTTLATTAVACCYGALLLRGRHPVAAKRASPRSGWLWALMLVSFLAAWTLWLPASIIGLATPSAIYPTQFPAGFMLAGGILGHAQAAINPWLYGVHWRRRFVTGSPAARAGVDGAAAAGPDARRSVTSRV